ncbi:hypothetical protein SABR111722_17430 [Saccharibacillus brassicae]
MLHVEQPLITPQRDYLVLVPDAANDKTVSRLIGAKLTVTKNGETVVSHGGAAASMRSSNKDDVRAVAV